MNNNNKYKIKSSNFVELFGFGLVVFFYVLKNVHPYLIREKSNTWDMK